MYRIVNLRAEPPGRWTFAEIAKDGSTKTIGPVVSFGDLLKEVNIWKASQGDPALTAEMLQDWLCRRAGGSGCIQYHARDETATVPVTVPLATRQGGCGACQKGQVR